MTAAQAERLDELESVPFHKVEDVTDLGDLVEFTMISTGSYVDEVVFLMDTRGKLVAS